jgi:serine/threonine-protein kinase
MSPEQARGDRTIDHRADVYAMGAILYELLSGKRPHPGDSHHAILHHISTQPAVPLASVQPGLDDALVAAVERALAPDPNARPSSADGFAQSIAAFARREVWPERRSDDSGRVRADVSSTLLAPGAPPARADARPATATTERAPITRRPTGRPRAVVWLAVFAGVGALALTVALLARRPAPGAASPQPGQIALPAQPPAAEGARVAPPPNPGALERIEPSHAAKAARDPAPAPATDGDRVRGPSEADDRGLPRARKVHARRADPAAGPQSDAPPVPAVVHFDQDNPYQ